MHLNQVCNLISLRIIALFGLYMKRLFSDLMGGMDLICSWYVIYYVDLQLCKVMLPFP